MEHPDLSIGVARTVFIYGGLERLKQIEIHISSPH
jgi:hypothetical protein